MKHITLALVAIVVLFALLLSGWQPPADPMPNPIAGVSTSPGNWPPPPPPDSTGLMLPLDIFQDGTLLAGGHWPWAPRTPEQPPYSDILTQPLAGLSTSPGGPIYPPV